MKKIFSILFLIIFSTSLHAQQKSYVKKIKAYQQAYTKEHEVVKEADKKYFRFFKADENYKLTAQFTPISDSSGFIMKTSGTNDKKYYRYGLLNFNINGKDLQLTLYQSEQLKQDSVYKNYLFLPFTDLTSGEESYGGGRYIDLDMDRIKNNRVSIDFNKAYNPYCVYATGYNCPIPPRENDLPVAILAGEKVFAKKNY